jgi:DNA-binding transcriptional ArsR family regulator
MSLESPAPVASANANEAAESPPARRLLDDPVSIRALAHPIRLELVAMVGRAGRLTAAEAARELGISQALASHHLRQLAKYGFVEQVPGVDKRERPWQPVATSLSWDDAAVTTEVAAAGAVLEQVSAERTVNQFLSWQRRRDQWGGRWQAVSGLSLTSAFLTSAELTELVTEVNAVIARHLARRSDEGPPRRPAGAAPVDITVIVVPAGTAPVEP